VDVGVARGLLELGLARVRVAHAQVVLHGAVKEVGVLAHHRDQASQVVQRERAQVVPTHRDAPGGRVREAQQQPRDRGLAGPARAHHADPLARGHLEHELVQGRAAAAGVGEGHVLEGDRGCDRGVCGEAIVLIGGERRRSSPEPPQRLGFFVCGGAVRGGFARGDVEDLRPHREQLADALGRREAEHALVEHHAQLAEWAEDLDPEHQHNHQGGQLHAPGLHAMGAEAEGHRGPERDAHVADAAGHGVGAEQPHGGLEEREAALLEQPRPRLALAEGGQRPQPLDRVEELGAVGLVGL